MQSIEQTTVSLRVSVCDADLSRELRRVEESLGIRHGMRVALFVERKNNEVMTQDRHTRCSTRYDRRLA